MSQRVTPCVAAFWMQRNTTLSTEKSSFFLDIFFARTLDIFVLAFYHFLLMEYGPVCDSLVFHQACQGGHFFGACFVGVGVGRQMMTVLIQHLMCVSNFLCYLT